MKCLFWIIACVGADLFLACPLALGQNPVDPLEYHFDGGYGQVEVGGPFVGAEFHESRPLPSRVSFYSPVANSLDVSSDYWKRGDSRPMAIGVRVDDRPPRWIGRGPWSYVLSPHAVRFEQTEDSLAYSIRYAFGMHEPIMVVRVTIKNLGNTRHHIGAYLHLKTTLRTCQTYARFDSASLVYNEKRNAAIATFEQPQTARAAVIIQNVGEDPSGWRLDAGSLAITDSGTSSWDGRPLIRIPASPKPIQGCAAFTYDRTLGPGDSLAAIVLIGSCRDSEANGMVERIAGHWLEDVGEYDRFIRSVSVNRIIVKTGDPWIDRSAIWASAILASNAHYLDGTVVPMPCPAEYNFFFTHDMLLTDLSAIAFDPARVKRDLLSIAVRARDNVIPHAYYWRDDGFKTEYCAPDNWNHLWFILAAASYLRHTMDSTVLNRLYPLLTTSVNSALQRLHSDNLMYAGAPDWWDIGKYEGPRSYMTVLVIRALREYTFISATLGKFSPRLLQLENTSRLMEKSLQAHLWDTVTHYLGNRNGGKRDPHYYMGSLLAPVFGLLDSVHAKELTATAQRELLAAGIGIRTAMPPDFHTDSVRAEFHFVGNEAGDPYLYANGGVWPHNNAWYALALRSTGQLDEAYRFYRATMTLDGVANSPMGQPAFYEYRFSDPGSPQYGKIDKPSFLWAAGFSLYTAYRLLGFDENEWNVSFASSLPKALDSAECFYEFGEGKQVRITRVHGNVIADGVLVPSRVVPLTLQQTKRWEVGVGESHSPALLRINATLEDAQCDSLNKQLTLLILSFKGHQVVAEIDGPRAPRRVLVNGKQLKAIESIGEGQGYSKSRIHFMGDDAREKVVIEY